MEISKRILEQSLDDPNAKIKYLTDEINRLNALLAQRMTELQDWQNKYIQSEYIISSLRAFEEINRQLELKYNSK